MRICLIACLAAMVSACGAETPPPATQVKIVEKVVEVQRPCPVARPAAPTPLARPLPQDSRSLAALLGAKLTEYAGAGGYVDQVNRALDVCLNP